MTSPGPPLRIRGTGHVQPGPPLRPRPGGRVAPPPARRHHRLAPRAARGRRLGLRPPPRRARPDGRRHPARSGRAGSGRTAARGDCPRAAGRGAAATARVRCGRRPGAAGAPPPNERYALESGPFTSGEAADRLEDQLNRLGYATVRFRKQATMRLFVVAATGFDSREEARRAAAELGRGTVIETGDGPEVLLDRLPWLGEAVAAARPLRARGFEVRVEAETGPAVIYHIRYGQFGSKPGPPSSTTSDTVSSAPSRPRRRAARSWRSSASRPAWSRSAELFGGGFHPPPTGLLAKPSRSLFSERIGPASPPERSSAPTECRRPVRPRRVGSAGARGAGS
ncbi:MAG: SPOR domain-containing protein [Candidatus Rokubacteria bacterium]|nr:SPOR domain-containing protein [Candidatus Rokubacteria bacterium]